ncbi:hypothetical protein [Sinomonas gamaensis]|uniref:hypothetical protein n=1 Tax=Sinomonas gamaensis TaxID=2565624 RepID=UPI001107A7F8|nr:hypothetical protein [Sinomonas gamaensis]
MKLRMVGWALVRRWYAALAGLIVVGAACALAYVSVPVDYKASGSLVLLPSAQSVGSGGNPYLFLGGLGQAMDVLTRRMAAAETVDKFSAQYPKMSYTALPDVTSGSSILVVAVKARSSATAEQALAAILADVPTELTAMQDSLHVPATSRISSMPVADPSPPVPDTKGQIQAVGAVGAAGIVLVVLFTALLDGLLLRQKRRREGGGGRKIAARSGSASHAAEPAYAALLVSAHVDADAQQRTASAEEDPEEPARGMHRRPSRSASAAR